MDTIAHDLLLDLDLLETSLHTVQGVRDDLHVLQCCDRHAGAGVHSAEVGTCDDAGDRVRVCHDQCYV